MAQDLDPPTLGSPPAAAQDDRGDQAGASPPDEPEDPATMDIVPEGLPASGGLSGQRSMPSVPRVGIPRSLQGWDRYEVLEVLGSGGMGAVYKARDPRLHRMVALKIVHPMLGHAPGSTGQVFVKRFVREARLQASLDHPHICKMPGGCRNSDGIA